jgi:hypothetical protein
VANPEFSVAQRNSHGYYRVEHEVAILLRRAHSNTGDLSREVHPDLQATAYALLASCTTWAVPGLRTSASTSASTKAP